MDGVVKSVRVKAGEYAQAIQPIIEITSPKNLIVRCDVLTDNVPALKIGQKIRVIQKTYSGDLEYQVEIIHIDDFAEPKISSLGLDEQRVESRQNFSATPNSKTATMQTSNLTPSAKKMS